MQLTEEQQAVRDATEAVLEVRAGAGTGKTSTLRAWAEAHPEARALYVAFGKGVERAAARTFPSSVTVKTSHALAYAAVGHRYREKLVTSLRPYTVLRQLGFPWVPPAQRLFWVSLVLDTLRAYLTSSATSITPALVPPVRPGPGVGRPDDWPADRLAEDARRVWACMQDPHDPRVGMVHDGYLKLFVLEQPRLPFDAILFDEAQDANPLTVQLIEGQAHARRIWVGDPHQSIYSFRGAVNAMDHLQADRRLHLTGSFRFGATVAHVATRLMHWRGGADPPLRGLADGPDAVWVGVPSGLQPYAFLARTNARIFAEAVAILMADPGTPLGFVGGVEGYRFDLIADVYRLWAGERPRDPFLHLFPSFAALEAYAEVVADQEILTRCRLVRRWQHAIPGWIRRIAAAAGPLERARVVLSTVHKAKGLEWAIVELADDLDDLVADAALWDRLQRLPPGPPREALQAALLPQEALNLWYVAVTRARQVLFLSSEALAQMLLASVPEPPSPGLGDGFAESAVRLGVAR